MKRILIATAALLLAAGTATAAEWKKLITADELSALDDVTVVDIRSPEAYGTAHVPGAVNAPYGKWRGPADNPGAVISDEALTALLQGPGLDHSDRVVITHAGEDQTDFGAAARVYWTLKSAGFPEIAILNGGVNGWVAAGEPVSTEAPEITPSDQTFALSDQWMIDREGIAAVLDGKRQAALVDARPTPFFLGETKHNAASAAGTLKGAQSFPFAAFFEGESNDLSDEGRVSEVASDIGEGDAEVVSFCNTGHWAATNWFALSEMAGKENVKLYPESMVGWVNNNGEAVKGN